MGNSELIKEYIDTFFVPSGSRVGDKFSALNLLIRQKEKCLDESCGVAVWPGIMTIFSGIDMLGFYYDDGCLLKSTKRFKAFYDRFFKHSKIYNESELIYQARNAMVHTFGLYAKDHNGTEYKFMYDWQEESDYVIHQNIDLSIYIINFYGLNKAFDKAIKNYKSFLIEELEINPEGVYIRNFQNAYELFGLISGPDRFSDDPHSSISSNASQIALGSD